jgi:hypothetical protein
MQMTAGGNQSHRLTTRRQTDDSILHRCWEPYFVLKHGLSSLPRVETKPLLNFREKRIEAQIRLLFVKDYCQAGA